MSISLIYIMSLISKQYSKLNELSVGHDILQCLYTTEKNRVLLVVSLM